MQIIQDEQLPAEQLLQDQASDTSLMVPDESPPNDSPPDDSTGAYVTQLTTAASLGLDIATLFTTIGFEAAKLGTGLGLNIAKQSMAMAVFILSCRSEDNEDSSLLGILESPINLGLTVATSTLTFAEFLALTGIQWTHNVVNTSLGAAKETVAVLDKFFGSNDTARCIAEFVALVKREWLVRGDEPYLPANFRAFTVLGAMKALTAWTALQTVTAEHWNARVMGHVTEIVVFGPNSAIYSAMGSVNMDQDFDGADNEETIYITQNEPTSSDNGNIVEGDIIHRPSSPSDGGSESSFATPPSTVSSIYYPFRSSTSPTSNEDIRELLRNLKRYSKFSLGAYGRDALAFFGVTLPPIPSSRANEGVANPHHFTFAHLTKTQMENVSGFSQTQDNAASAPSSYLIRDHNSSSVILALRGTFSLNDLVVDLTCEELDFKLPDELDDPSSPVYKVHSGMIRVAKKLATPGPGTVFDALKKALDENQNYGLVIVGHSLGAGIGSLLALLIASPTTRVTTASSGLPPNRPVHAFAFASPCTMSAALSRRSEGLVTSLVYADDVVTRLSIGSVRDLRNITAWLIEGDKDEPLYANIISKALNYQAGMYEGDSVQKRELENWFVSLRTTLHANMQSDKLYPGGTVYWILPITGGKMDAGSVAPTDEDDPKEASYKLYKIDDVEQVLSEIIFSRNMISDHFPLQYEYVMSRSRERMQ
ncbi:hypothetical protein BC936DRAFT_145427 [Jimgerdemannia flammicorona]|uniref:sn-1-specific diacylglycerol lipase n=1 Tax=Jimgerdemannia flammicorona TaxID=994334 RepID=A0A433DA16_9FUNG|nr:hypothetical protein BC936DRAFT_145427 [Jimgerdemannia flammicorona]